MGLERALIPVHLKVVGDVYCFALHYLDIVIVGSGEAAVAAFHLRHLVVYHCLFATLWALCFEHAMVTQRIVNKLYLQ